MTMDQRLPPRRKPEAGSFDTRPAQLEAWIADLPMINVGEASRRLFNALLEMNNLAISASQRFKALEMLLSPVAEVTEAMKKHYVGRHFPLPDKARKVAELTRALLGQMATGYRIVVEDESQKSLLTRDKKLLATAIHRALSQLGLVLLKAYQVYAPYPPGVWGHIHHLYRLAENRKLLGTAVKALESEPVPATIGDVYKQILLLALACPYRLRQGQVEQVYAILGDWCRSARMTPLTEPENPSGVFVVNLDSDDPPTYLVLRRTCYDADACRLLETRELAEKVHHELSRHRRNGSAALPEPLLRRLMLAWGVMPKRKFSRKRKHSSATVAMGLSAAHYFISGEQVFVATPGEGGQDDPLFDTPARFEARETHDNRNKTPDLWDLHDTHRWHRDTNGVRMVSLDWEDEDPPSQDENNESQPRYQAQEWKMIDVSAGGYRLLWDSSASSQAVVGELIGIRESQDPDAFHLGLGVIRWMKATEDHGLELGVEMLSPGGVAIAVRSPKTNGYQRSLILPEIRAVAQPATLITPSIPFHIGDIILVNSHGKEVRVELTKLVENTGAFAQFQFRPLDTHSRPMTPEGEPDPGDFEGLWNEL